MLSEDMKACEISERDAKNLSKANRMIPAGCRDGFHEISVESKMRGKVIERSALTRTLDKEKRL